MSKKMSNGYDSKVIHRFTAGGERWEVEGFGEDRVFISETTKNGQEDCHVSAELTRGEDGIWRLDEFSRTEMRDYFYEHTPAEVERFLNKYGAPEK